MTYQETLDYIFEKLPMFHRIGQAAYKADLNNITLLVNKLKDPHKKFKSIHIAGTNGKGSVSHMIASIFSLKGYKTGLCTSPHLLDFRERIKIDGKMIPEDFVVDFIHSNKELIEEIKPSFFEIVIAMSFHYFAQQEVDYAVIETGLGGRLDSTNIIQPVLSVITNISYDHEYFLGDTLQKISSEKAGIIKPNIPVVIGDKHPETSQIFIDKGKSSGSAVYFAEDDYSYTLIKSDSTQSSFKITDTHKNKYLIQCDLPGTYQGKNIITVLKSMDILNQMGMNIDFETIKKGIQFVKRNTGLRGRWDKINDSPLMICDIAHNEGAITELVHQLSNCKYNSLHIVFGVSKDKNIDYILDLLPKNAIYYFCKSSVPRSLDEAILYEFAVKHQLYGKSFPTVIEALESAKDAAKSDDLILITGSAFVVADAMKMYNV